MSRISKGKLRNLWALYNVESLIIARALGKWYYPLGIGKHRFSHNLVTAPAGDVFVSAMATRGYYEGARRLITESDFEMMVEKSDDSLETFDPNLVLNSEMEKIIITKGGRASRRMGKPSDPNVSVAELFAREMIIATGSMDKLQNGDEPAAVS